MQNYKKKKKDSGAVAWYEALDVNVFPCVVMI